MDALKATLAERESELESIKASVAEKDAKLEDMDRVVSEQGEEIQSAQEKFQTLLSTIENELGTEIPVQSPGEESQEQPAADDSQKPAGESAQPDFFG